MSFAKLDSGIVNSTLWVQPDDVLRVWIWMLSQADANGVVRTAAPALALVCMKTVGRIREILALLESPDPDSRSGNDDGRRLRKVEGGWQIINYAAYRERRSEEATRERKREWDREHRGSRPNARYRQSDSSPTQSDAPPTAPDSPRRNPTNPTQAEADTEAQEQKQKQPSPAAKALPSCPDWIDPEAWAGFVAMRQRIRFPLTARAAQLVFKELQKLDGNPNEILDQSTRNGWRDVYALKEARPNQSTPAPAGKQMQGLMALEAMKSGNRLAAGRNPHGIAEALPAVAGPDSRR